jgi:sporulation protein YlmC with PRC-barrel domain
MHGNMQLDSMVAMGSAYAGGKVLGYPGGERVNPDLVERPVVEDGTDVLDVNGEKVGDVSGLSFSSDDGSITGLKIQEGFLFKKETEIPAAWVEDVTANGVVLNVAKEEVEGLFGD